MSRLDEAWIARLTQLVGRTWGLGDNSAGAYLRTLRFDHAPADLAGEIAGALLSVRSEGLVLVIVHSAIGWSAGLGREGVHELAGAARLIAQPVPRSAPFDELGPLWLGVATKAVEKVGSVRALLSQIAAPRLSDMTGLEAGAAALIALECGTIGAADGLQHLAAEEISPDALLRVQALWRWNLAQSAALEAKLAATSRQMTEATIRAGRAERDLEIARADHRANVARLMPFAAKAEAKSPSVGRKARAAAAAAPEFGK
ncbi:MAG: hypothetical protein C0481_02375 [Phenylobacterium sp.]|uniref:hypothetical protein n=1 Tax=Phenylobacterium sp. TaxID=1871053 RepID=UPI0025CC3AFB|nr:hypothetical protein [Phenylobacterium sp.]MBA4010690.1 hypothetical protein [Phenylobacterium sp.]